MHAGTVAGPAVFCKRLPRPQHRDCVSFHHGTPFLRDINSVQLLLPPNVAQQMTCDVLSAREALRISSASPLIEQGSLLLFFAPNLMNNKCPCRAATGRMRTSCLFRKLVTGLYRSCSILARLHPCLVSPVLHVLFLRL
jgi:hypothetical protein